MRDKPGTWYAVESRQADKEEWDWQGTYADRKEAADLARGLNDDGHRVRVLRKDVRVVFERKMA